MSGGQRSRMVLSILQCTGRPHSEERPGPVALVWGGEPRLGRRAPVGEEWDPKTWGEGTGACVLKISNSQVPGASFAPKAASLL